MRWLMLVALSAVLAAALGSARLPAALLLGPMLAGIALAASGIELRLPALPVTFAQGVVGCLIARSITPGVIASFADQWFLFLGMVSAIVAVSVAMGMLVGRLGVLPGTTAVWGMMPGAAPAMMLMAEAFGADTRLVAFMQYVRVVLVAVCAAAVSRLWLHGTPGPAPSSWFPPVDVSGFAAVLGVSSFAVIVGRYVALPAAAMLGALLLAAVIHVGGFATLAMPPWFLAANYAILGWYVGLRFTRPVLAAAARALPQTIASMAVLIAACGGLAVLLVAFLGVDPLSAYLATSPGGMDSVAIIAATTPVDVPFVMAMQLLRFLLILLVGPILSRLVSRRIASAEAI